MMDSLRTLTQLQLNTFTVCATSWQQEGFALPNEGSFDDLQVLCGHLSILMQLHTAKLEGHPRVRTHEILPAKGKGITLQLSFLFMHGLIKLGAQTDYSWVMLTPSGESLAKRLCRPPKTVVH
jgi:hypothetical protein